MARTRFGEMPEQAPIYGYYVSGHRIGGFPLDMLRFSQSYPIDSDYIHRLIVAPETGDYSSFPDKVLRVKLCTVQDPESRSFKASCERWKSFGWAVVEVTDYEDCGALGFIPREVLEAAQAEDEKCDQCGDTGIGSTADGIGHYCERGCGVPI